MVRAGHSGEESEKERAGERENRREAGFLVERMRSVGADEGAGKRDGEKRIRETDQHLVHGTHVAVCVDCRDSSKQ